MEAHSALLFLSAVTVAEIEDGLARLRCEGATRKSEILAAWLETVLHLYGDRILSFDAPTARIAGLVRPRTRPRSGARIGRHYHRGDGAAQSLTILSRNVRHFEPLGVSV